MFNHEVWLLVFCVCVCCRKIYRLIPFQFQKRERRSSTSSSRRPLEPDDLDPDHDHDHDHDPEHSDHPKPQDAEMFTIEDFDMEPDNQSRGTNDEYFYDEVFRKPVFEDEVTNASMRELYLTAAEDDEVDVDEIVERITGHRSTSSHT